MQGAIKAPCIVRHKCIPEYGHDLRLPAHGDNRSRTGAPPCVVRGRNAIRIVGTFLQNDGRLDRAWRPNYCDVEPKYESWIMLTSVT